MDLNMDQILEIFDKLRRSLDDVESLPGILGDPNTELAISVSMDTAEDAAEAMLAYERTPFKPDEFGENYLRLYGFLQAIFLQQDALKELHRRFLKSEFKTEGLPAWDAIRMLRNRTTGHPIFRGNFERIFIARVTLNQWFFQYQIWNEDSQTIAFADVDLKELFGAYKSVAIDLLQKILGSIPHHN
jgi:hypothetical protein